ncbi:DUF6397 family protein [Streptomyces sp. NPDC008150]|uniref:DUF6397 family protein n=1 Tax=Streptomyces sp. NPDC008150 TaxID=3364816 RepID=UPI0036EBE181
MPVTIRTSAPGSRAKTSGPPGPAVLTTHRAARELALGRSAFEAGVSLGHIRTLPAPDGSGARVARTEIERLRAEPDFPRGLRLRTETAGTRDGAALLGIAPGRFGRLARLGLLSPATFRVNRYRTVVWLYPTEELRVFGARSEHAALLAGRMPTALRDQLITGLDLRPRNWRTRHLCSLTDAAHGPWERAAAVASLLDPVEVARAVPDRRDRTHLERCRPPRPDHGAPGSPAAQLAEILMTARESDEVALLVAELRHAVAAARIHDPVPDPDPATVAAAGPEAEPIPGPPLPGPPRPQPGRTRPRRLIARLRLPHRQRPDATPVLASGPGAPPGRRHPGAEPYSARNSPSCTTDTSSRPSTS